MGCCDSTETQNRGYRTADYGDVNHNPVVGGGNENHEEIARKRMDYYNRDDVKKKQIIRNFD